MQDILNKKFDEKNLFTRLNTSYGIMIKCFMGAAGQFQYGIIDISIKKVPNTLSYSVSEERQYFEVYIPSYLLKKYDYNVKEVVNSKEVCCIIKKIINVKQSLPAEPYYYANATSKLVRKSFCDKLKTLQLWNN